MYTRRLSLASLALVFCFFSAAAVKADVIAVWNFNDANLLVDRGQGTLTTTATNIMFLTGTNFEASTIPIGDPAGLALTIPGGPNLQNNGSVVEIHVSTLGFENIAISWAWQRNDTGFNDDVIRGVSMERRFRGLALPGLTQISLVESTSVTLRVTQQVTTRSTPFE